MSALGQRRRRQTVLMIGANVAVLALVAVLLTVGRHALGRYTAAKRAEAGLPTVDVPDTPTAMFATVDEFDRLTSLAVFVLSPTSTGGSIVTVPVNVDSTQGAGDRRLSLIDAYASGGRPGLVQATEAVLSVTLDYDQIAGPAKAATLLAPVAPIPVDLPATVVDDRNGSTKVLFQRGQRSLGAADAVEVLAATSTTVSEAARTPNLEAVWAGVAKSVGQGRAAGALSPTVTTFDELVAHLLAGPLSTRGLPLGTFPADVPNIGDADIAPLDRAKEIVVFASIAPGSMSRPADGLAVRIVAPPGSEARVEQAVAVFLYAGDNVAWIDLTGQSEPSGKVFAYDESYKPHFEDLRPFVGPFSFATPDSQPDGIDATVELGTDFLQQSGPVASPPTSSSTTVPGG